MTIKKGSFVSVNDVPDKNEIQQDTNKSTTVKEDFGGNCDVNIDVVPASQPGVARQPISSVDLVWGFMLNAIPTMYTDGNSIYFDGEISKDSVDMLKQAIISVGQTTLAQYHQLGIHDPRQMCINLNINSPGGVIPAGWDLIDFMNRFYIPINTIGTGTVASMGVMILMAGQKRSLTKNTHILIHQYRAVVQGKRQDLLDYMKHYEDIQTQIVNFFTTHSKLTEVKVNEVLQHETWMTAEIALSNGIVDTLV